MTDTLLASSSSTHISTSPSSSEVLASSAGLSLGSNGTATAAGGVSGGGTSPSAVLDVSGAIADRQIEYEDTMFQWLFTHTHGIHPDTSHTYAQAFYAAKMITIDRVAKKVGKEPGFLLSLGVDEDDADDIVRAMRDARVLMAP